MASHLSGSPLNPPNEYFIRDVDDNGHPRINLDSPSARESRLLFNTLNHYSRSYEDNSGLAYANRDDMEDGLPLSITQSHAQILEAVPNMLDSEIAGEHNVEILHADNRFHDNNQESFPNQGDTEVFHQDSNPNNRGPQRTNYQPEIQFGVMSGVNSNTNTVSDQAHTNGEHYLQIPSVEEDVNRLYRNYDHTSAPFGLQPMISDTPPMIINSSLDSTQSRIIRDYSAFRAQDLGLNPSIPHTWPIEGNLPSTPSAIESSHEAHNDPSPAPSLNLVNAGVNEENPTNNNMIVIENQEAERQTNFDLYGTLRHWCDEIARIDPRHSMNFRGPFLPAVEALREIIPETVQRFDLRGDECDIQNINWKALGISRSEAQHRRKYLYRNFTNIKYSGPFHPRLTSHHLKNCENYFRFRRMDFKHEVNMIHFQLRNLISCPTRDHIFYAGRSKILHYNPSHGENSARISIAMDLSNPEIPSLFSQTRGIQISTMSVGHNILIVGGFCGEYGLVNLNSEKGSKHIQGLITENPNSIINHIQIHSTRSKDSPIATFASNHTSLRLLDIYTNKFVSEHHYDHAINCTAISPDLRLRVMVGDTRQVLICDAETGKLLQSLDGHHDYGFACDWADDGWTIATGNQDQQIKIWDARKWTNSQGAPYPIATVAANMAGARKLKFSPLGSGKRVLVAAEPVDYISIIDAERFASKQTISLFGEISGFDFTNDGQDLFVANVDSARGGILEFERSNHAEYGRYGLESIFRPNCRIPNYAAVYDWMNEIDIFRHPKSKMTPEVMERRVASLGTDMGFF